MGEVATGIVIKMKAVIALCVLACVSGTQFLPYREIVGKNCDPSLNGFTVTALTVAPWPPQKSGNFTVNLTGTFNVAATLKEVDATILMDGVAFTTMVVPASGTFAAGDTYTNSFSEPVPAFMPSGSYAVKTSLIDVATGSLGCWEVDFTL